MLSRFFICGIIDRHLDLIGLIDLKLNQVLEFYFTPSNIDIYPLMKVLFPSSSSILCMIFNKKLWQIQKILSPLHQKPLPLKRKLEHSIIDLPGPMTRKSMVKGTTMTNTSIRSMFFRRKCGLLRPIFILNPPLVKAPGYLKSSLGSLLPFGSTQQVFRWLIETQSCPDHHLFKQLAGLLWTIKTWKKQSQRMVADWIPLFSIKQILTICGWNCSLPSALHPSPRTTVARSHLLWLAS